MRFVNGDMPLWDYHWQRMQKSLQQLQWSLPSNTTKNGLWATLRYLLWVNEMHSARMRLSITRNEGKQEMQIGTSQYDTPHFVLKTGINLGLFTANRKTEGENLKLNNDKVYIAAQAFQKESDFDEVLVLNNSGFISDASISNLWAVQDAKLVTPPLGDNGVAGVMREFIKDRSDWSVIEKKLKPETLIDYDELFLTNAGRGFRSVSRFREKDYDNTQTKRLFSQLEPLLNGK